MVKKKKHPDAPKSAMGAYMWFCQDKREEVKSDMPELSAKEILSELGKRWSSISEDEKARYTKLADQDKERFNVEKQEFLKTHDSLFIDDDSKKGSRKKKDPNAPKRARSAYLIFTAEYRPQVAEQAKAEGAKQTVIMSRLAKMWKDASPEEKEKYHKQAEAEKEDYAKALDSYKSTLGNGAGDYDDDDEDEEEDSD